MTEQTRLAKNKQIAISKHNTKLKRKNQVCKVYEVKIDIKKLSKLQFEQLKMMFIELKWLKNDMIRWSNETGEKIWNYNKLNKDVIRKDKDGNSIQQKLIFTPTQITQDFINKTISNIRTLSTLKKKQYKIGKLKFVKEIKSIPLRQYGKTHNVITNHRIKITGINKTIRVNGLKQFYNKNIDIANAVLIQNSLGYYVKFTTYENKNNEIKKQFKKPIGIDFGCKTSFTTSDGEKINIKVQESERLKHLQKVFAKSKSSKRFKYLQQIKKEYQKITNRKNDLANKIVAQFLEHEKVAIQDEQLQKWQKNYHGKAIQYSVLGRVKSKLLQNTQTILINKFVPTTKICLKCGTIHNELKLSDRIFTCSCEYSEDRDIHAAKNILWFALNNVGVGRTEFKRVEMMENIIDKISCQNVNLLSRKHETINL
jgi:putative transposase